MGSTERKYNILFSLIKDNYSRSSCIEVIDEIANQNGFDKEYYSHEFLLVQELQKANRPRLLEHILSVDGNYNSYIRQFGFDEFLSPSSLENDWVDFDEKSFKKIKKEIGLWKIRHSDSNWYLSLGLRFWLVKFFLEQILKNEVVDLEKSMISDRGYLNPALFRDQNILHIKHALSFFEEQEIIEEVFLDPDFSMNDLLHFRILGRRLNGVVLSRRSLQMGNFDNRRFPNYRDYPICRMFNQLSGFADACLMLRSKEKGR